MVAVRRSFTVDRPVEAVLGYLADFGNTREWDPGTESCTRLDEGPIRVGSRWHNVSRFRGRTTELSYRLVRHEPARLTFVGENRTVTATDDITLSARGDRTEIVYDARLRFKGVARLVAPLLKGEFERLADGVERTLPAVLGAS
ncbi:SRPBCC family protein [Kitasatospora sp. NBC_00315]|uniref:SRPBCC family protein n=1 Tax=Kitasatospora sp. NBC_00315 TaxID=2975963 RepID=UPI00324C0254